MTLKLLSHETLLSSRTAQSGLERLREVDLIETVPLEEDKRKNLYKLRSTDRDGVKKDRELSPCVSVEWVEDHLPGFKREETDLRLIETDDKYEDGHIPGAVQIDITKDFNEPGRHTLVDRPKFENCMSERGISEDSTVIVYSTRKNQLASYLYWLFNYYRHADVRLLEGGKERWIESGRPLASHRRSVSSTEYTAHPSNERIRAYRHDIEEALDQGSTLLDVRTTEEFTGENPCPSPDLPEARNTGHIPETAHLEWTQVLNDHGEFKGRKQLKRLFEQLGIYPHDKIIVYCHVGWRSALVWFVLSELLSYPKVANYDGSWIEWGNLVDAPIKDGTDVN